MTSRNDRLAEHYLKASRVAGVAISLESGKVDVVSPVPIASGSRLIYCCNRVEDAIELAGKLHGRTCEPGNISSLNMLSDYLVATARNWGFGITPHHQVADRAHSAVATVNASVAELQHKGGMKRINSTFRTQRERSPTLRYSDFLHAHKESLLEAMAKEIKR